MEAIRQAREEAGLSQRAVSALLGRKHNHMNMIERGQRIPNVLECIHVLEVIGADPMAVLTKVVRSKRAAKA